MAEPNDPLAPLRSLLPSFAGTQARGAAPVVTAGTAQAAPVLPQQPVQQETSLLEQLRQRVQQDLAPRPMTSQERLATFGRGVLSNRGSFLDNLSAGLAAQQQAEAGRREEGRKAAELEATIAERDRRAQLEKAKFAEETTPGTLTGRLTEARIRQADAAAAQANRPQYQIVGTDAQGNAVVVDMRDPTRTRTLEGVRPTRSDIAANAAEERIRGRALSNAARAVDEEMKLNPTLNRENRIRQLFPVYLELARREERAASGGGSQQPPASTESTPPQRLQYQPPR